MDNPSSQRANLHADKLTFHPKLGATAIFVDENEEDEKQDTGKTCQTHGNRYLRRGGEGRGGGGGEGRGGGRGRRGEWWGCH